jgi:hypothetical protein
VDRIGELEAQIKQMQQQILVSLVTISSFILVAKFGFGLIYILLHIYKLKSLTKNRNPPVREAQASDELGTPVSFILQCTKI